MRKNPFNDPNYPYIGAGAELAATRSELNAIRGKLLDARTAVEEDFAGGDDGYRPPENRHTLLPGDSVSQYGMPHAKNGSRRPLSRVDELLDDPENPYGRGGRNSGKLPPRFYPQHLDVPKIPGLNAPHLNDDVASRMNPPRRPRSRGRRESFDGTILSDATSVFRPGGERR